MHRRHLLLAARALFLAANRAVMLDLFEDLQRGTQWFLDPAKRKEAIGRVLAFTKRPASVCDFRLFTHTDDDRSPEAVPNVAALQNYYSHSMKLRISRASPT